MLSYLVLDCYQKNLVRIIQFDAYLASNVVTCTLFPQIIMILLHIVFENICHLCTNTYIYTNMLNLIIYSIICIS